MLTSDVISDIITTSFTVFAPNNSKLLDYLKVIMNMTSKVNKVDKKQLEMLISDSLSLLKKDRDRDIILRRYGIATGSTQTLEEIGKDMGITRERVRQIEKAAITKIRQQFKHDHQLNDNLIAITNNKGGIIGFASLINELNLDGKNQPHLSFLIKVNPKFTFLDKNDSHADMLFLSDSYNENGVLKLQEQLVTVISNQGKPSRFDKFAKQFDSKHKQEALLELAIVSTNLANLDNIWGLSIWPEVNPKSIRDKIYLVLKKNARPMHFSEISTKISELKANPKNVTTQAVHNELIKDGRFVLIGRGIYALGEWGYNPGTVADIIAVILRERSPLSKEDIITKVLARRQVKTTTIALNLQEKPQFIRDNNDMYRLKDDYEPSNTNKRRGGRTKG